MKNQQTMENSNEINLSSKDLLSLKDQKTSEKNDLQIFTASESKSRSENLNINKYKLKKQEVTKIPRFILRNKNSHLNIKEGLKIDSLRNITSTVCGTVGLKLMKMDSENNHNSHSQTELQRFKQKSLKMISFSTSTSSSSTTSSSTKSIVAAEAPTDELSLSKVTDHHQIEVPFCISNTCSFIVDPKKYELTPKISGMKIFASIMLNAWRKRRDDVKRLRDELNRMKKNNMKIKNQIHVLNSLFRIEQKQNDTLHYQLKKCEESTEKIQDMFFKLDMAHNELQEKKITAEANLELENKENDGLNLTLEMTTAQLVQTMGFEKELTELLNLEQEKTIKLENEKNLLYKKIRDLEAKIENEENEHQNKILSKENLISSYKAQLDALEKTLNEMKSTETKLIELRNVENVQKQLIENMTNETNLLQSQLDNTFMKYLKSFFYRNFSTKALHYVHLISFYLLPAVPPPSPDLLQQMLQAKKC